MEFAVFIPSTPGREELLERLLSSLKKASDPSELRSIYIVENGSLKPTLERYVLDAQKQLPKLRYLHNIPGNKSIALNFAIEKAISQTPGLSHLLFFDDDIKVSSTIFFVYRDAFLQDPGKTYWGGPFDVEYEKEAPPDWLREFLPKSVLGWAGSDSTNKTHFFGCNFAAPLNAWKILDGFNPDRGPGTQARGQETDFMFRLIQDGFQSIFLAKANVCHWVTKQQVTEDWALKRIESSSYGSGLQNRTTSSYQRRLRILVCDIKMMILSIYSKIGLDKRKINLKLKRLDSFKRGIRAKTLTKSST